MAMELTEREQAAKMLGGMLTPHEAARLLSVSNQRVYQLIKSGQLRGWRVGWNYFVDPESVSEWRRNRKGECWNGIRSRQVT
jgi:excisionase family DNA binding protein